MAFTVAYISHNLKFFEFSKRNIVPAYVEMMGLIGMGNNPMFGATVAVSVSVA